MFKPKSFATALSLFLFLFFSGCNNNVAPLNEVSSLKKLTKIVQDANNYSLFSYVNGKLSKLETISNSKLFRSISLNYDGKNKPQTENYITPFQELLKKYYYDSSSKLDSMDIMFVDGTNIYKQYRHLKYYYNSLNQLSKTEYYNTEYKLIFTTEYKYDGAGNTIERRFYDSNGLNELTKMTYNNKINPWYILKDWLIDYNASMSKNNLTSSSSIYSNNSQKNTETIFTYTYNSDNYPISKTMEITRNNIKTTLTERYEYK